MARLPSYHGGWAYGRFASPLFRDSLPSGITRESSDMMATLLNQLLGPCGSWLSLLVSAPLILGFAGLGVWCLFRSWAKLWLSIPGMKFR